jgi:hypothetical protein
MEQVGSGHDARLASYIDIFLDLLSFIHELPVRIPGRDGDLPR